MINPRRRGGSSKRYLNLRRSNSKALPLSIRWWLFSDGPGGEFTRWDSNGLRHRLVSTMNMAFRIF